MEALLTPKSIDDPFIEKISNLQQMNSFGLGGNLYESNQTAAVNSFHNSNSFGQKKYLHNSK